MDFLKNCLKLEQELRPSSSELLQHPYFDKNFKQDFEAEFEEIWYPKPKKHKSKIILTPACSPDTSSYMKIYAKRKSPNNGMNKYSNDFKNVHIMANKAWSYTNNGEKYVFLGASNMNGCDSNWLDGHIEEANEMEEGAVCLTHSPPIISSGLVRKPVCAWIHGQTIECVRNSIGNIPILSNSFANVMNPCYSPKKSVVILR